MIIDKLIIDDFGKFHNKEIILRPGLNIIYGDNEAGKSTIKEYIVGMIYGLDKLRGAASRKDLYTLKKPLFSGNYKGKIIFHHNGIEYNLKRDFLINQRNIELTNLSNGRRVDLDSPGTLEGTFINTSKAVYENTLCIDEKNCNNIKDLGLEIKNTMVNISNTRSQRIDYTGSIEYLKNEKKKYNTKELYVKLEDLKNKLDFINKNTNLQDISTDSNKVQLELKEKLEKIKKEQKEKEYNIKQELKRLHLQKINEEKPDSFNNSQTSENTYISANANEIEGTKNTLENKSGSFDFTFKKVIGFIIGILFLGILLFIIYNKLDNKVAIYVLSAIGVIVYGGIFKLLFFNDSKEKEAKGQDGSLVNTAIGNNRYNNTYTNNDILEIGKKEHINREDNYEREINHREQKLYEALQLLGEEYSMHIKDVTLRYGDRLGEIKAIEEQKRILQENKEELVEEYKILREKIKYMETEKKAIEVAIETIQKLSEKIYDDFGQELNRQVSHIVYNLTNKKYSQVMLNENMEINIYYNSTIIGIEYLSAGTKEQIYFAIRLAAAKLLVHDQLPLILDDIFMTYDQGRVLNAMNLLKDYGNGQIILFTSNKYIGDILDSIDTDYNYVEL